MAERDAGEPANGETGSSMKKLAVVLFNLGGPDEPDAVRPFLFNLFNDPAIIALPTIVRWPLAKLISGKRAPVAREIYANLGGGSPLLPNTQAQANALELELAGTLGAGTAVKVFIAMRYWHPMSDETARAVAGFEPDEIVLLPLYPQYSCTTSGSSIKEWRRAAGKAGLAVPTKTVCCYPRDDGFVAEVARLVAEALTGEALTGEALTGGGRNGETRILFSAHGLPKKVVEAGDPYQWQVEESVAAVLEKLAQRSDLPGFDPIVCYQSRVGPLEWIGPSTEDEIERAGKDGKPLLVVPIAFVSEHSETLVELDIEYGELAEKCGVPTYVRVKTVDAGRDFVTGLANAVVAALRRNGDLSSNAGMRLCPSQCGRCPMASDVA